MTKREMATHLGITPMTLRNWRKHKPNLYAIILRGFAFDETLKQSKRHYEALEALANELKQL